MSAEALRALVSELDARIEEFRARSLNLDMTRGKPSPRQLNLSNGLLEYPGASDYTASDGSDCRNYGGLVGLPEARSLFAAILGAPVEQVIVGDNSSLRLMHDALVRACVFGVPGGAGPWREQGPLRFLCPCPGYDRHFTIAEHLGFELVPIAMTEAGPDLKQVESAVADDPAVKGIWCVPRYSNPTGAVYSDEVVDRLASMATAATDFRIFWDNAYAEHHISDDPVPLKNILESCTAANQPDRVLMFASTSKITLAGSGISAMAGSEANVADALRHLAVQTVGPDKINQLRHVMFLKDIAGLREHMRRHAELLKPKFDIVQDVLHRELDGYDCARWTDPRGGYFVSLDTNDGCASQVVRLAGELGVKVTPAGATFPYGRDPLDRNIRIAPTFPQRDDIRAAVEVLAVCVKRVAASRILDAGPAAESDA